MVTKYSSPVKKSALATYSGPGSVVRLSNGITAVVASLTIGTRASARTAGRKRNGVRRLRSCTFMNPIWKASAESMDSWSCRHEGTAGAKTRPRRCPSTVSRSPKYALIGTALEYSRPRKPIHPTLNAQIRTADFMGIRSTCSGSVRMGIWRRSTGRKSRITANRALPTPRYVESR